GQGAVGRQGGCFLSVPCRQRFLYQIACPSEGQILTVRHYQRTPEGQKFDADYKVPIDGVWLGGTPALTGDPGPDSLAILLPLADGSIQRVSVGPNAAVGGGGPTWRSARADDEARGHVVRINAAEFLVTDGSSGLAHWVWKVNDPGFELIGAPI